MAEREYAPAELMAAVLSRELRDDDFGAVGAAAQIPMCAMRLAQRTHAPNLWSLYGGSGAVNSKLPALLESAADHRNLAGAEYRASLNDIIDYEFTGRFTVAFLGGMQVDQYGAMNMVCVGDYARPRVRGPGTVGLAFMSAFQRVLIYVQHHDARIFVPQVDFLSGPGHRDAAALARYRPKWAQGPVLVVTPLAVMDFATPDHRMRLRSVHPGHTVDEVAARTGFPLATTGEVPFTEPPTAEELRIIREELDPDGVLRRLVA
jgi:glutaconate CoA-transferase subunit B